MENKLQQLTQKLYEEGLEKGRAESGRLVEEARAEAAKILADARAEAEKIERQAAMKAEELTKNTRTELTLASRQSVASLREMIGNMITSAVLDKAAAKVSVDEAFIKDMILAIAGNWSGASGVRPDLTVMLPAAMEARFTAAVKGSLAGLLASGVELKYSNGVKSGFRIGPKDAGYHISFTEEDFRALIGGYLRPKVAELLYGE